MNNKFFLLIITIGLLISALLIINNKHISAVSDNTDISDDVVERIDDAIYSETISMMHSLVLNKEIIALLSEGDGGDPSKASIIIDAAKNIFDVSIIYLMDLGGNVIVSTTYDTDKSLLGENYSFRYYFNQAVEGKEIIYPALGVTTKKRGLYFSFPVFSDSKSKVIGVLIFKKDLDSIDTILKKYHNPIFLISPAGIVFASNIEKWLYHTVKPLTSEETDRIISSRQFGDIEISPLPFDLSKSEAALENKNYHVKRSPFWDSEWQIVMLQEKEDKLLIDTRILTIITIIPVVLILIIFALVKVILYRKKTENELRKAHDAIAEREKKLKIYLNEKDIMLKEIHHRVKNNMQIIDSLLAMQASKADDVSNIQGLKKSRSRIRAMSLVHELLYETDNFTSINLGMYITALVQDIIAELEVQHDNISRSFDLDDIPVSIDQAIPLGLIINELVTNTFKYAFSEGMTGNLTITLKQTEKKECLLVIKDDGSGLPGSFSYENVDTLGFMLVKNLVEQIEGVMDIDRNRGVSYYIRFQPK